MTNGAQGLRKFVHRGWMGLPGCSSWFPSTEVEDPRDGSWLLSHPSGADVDRLAYSLHYPMAYSSQTGG
jgi:hypothetical protein